jgi:SAM-dependent methyltransferase
MNELIHPSDDMFTGDMIHYLSVGESAINCIESIWPFDVFPDTILDLPSGYGRVARYLTEFFPKSTITVCDINKEAIEFCATQFGAIPLLSNHHPSKIDFPSRYDLIWCGSLLTHLDSESVIKWLNVLGSCLSSGGVLIFTTHGRSVASRYSGNSKLFIDYALEGFGFDPYPNHPDYGTSVCKLSWVIKHLENLFPSTEFSIISSSEHLWDNNQDVIAIQRAL